MPEMGGIIQTRVYESSPIRQLASQITVGTHTYEYILDNGEADGEWVGELQAPSTETTPQLGKLAITVHELAAKPKASQKMLDDGKIHCLGTNASGTPRHPMARGKYRVPGINGQCFGEPLWRKPDEQPMFESQVPLHVRSPAASPSMFAQPPAG